VLARVLEAHGIATTSISLVREHTERIKPPRALFVPFPFGYALGRPNDPALQHRVLGAALALLDAPSGPRLDDFPDDAEPGDTTPAPVQASAVTAAAVPADALAEIGRVLPYHAQWMAKNAGRTAFGLSGVGAERFVDVVAFLQTFAAGGDGDLAGRPAGVPLPAFVRWSADDLKALYYERRLLEQPAAAGDAIARWFWGETAAGQLLRRVRDRLDASQDAAWKAAAFGVAR
jgi:hypothetical protein